MGTDSATHNAPLCTPGLKIADADTCDQIGGFARGLSRRPMTDRDGAMDQQSPDLPGSPADDQPCLDWLMNTGHCYLPLAAGEYIRDCKAPRPLHQDR